MSTLKKTGKNIVVKNILIFRELLYVLEYFRVFQNILDLKRIIYGRGKKNMQLYSHIKIALNICAATPIFIFS